MWFLQLRCILEWDLHKKMNAYGCDSTWWNLYLCHQPLGREEGQCSSCMQLRWFCSYLAKIGLAWYSCHCNKKWRRIICISCSSAWPHVETISFHFFAMRRNSMFMIAILVVKICISAYTWHWENSSMQWQCIRTCWMRKTRGQNCTFRGTIAEKPALVHHTCHWVGKWGRRFLHALVHVELGIMCKLMLMVAFLLSKNCIRVAHL